MGKSEPWELEDMLLMELEDRKRARSASTFQNAPDSKSPTNTAPAKTGIENSAAVASERSRFKTFKDKLIGCPYEEGTDRRRVGEVKPATYEQLYNFGFRALCLSGGGIRSATFGLGILQALAVKGKLSDLDYISTVSGGGYIGAWLSAWCARSGKNIADLEDQLADDDRRSPRFPEPPELYTLRNFTNYLTPRSGLFSSDTWAGLATLVRNLILNWLLFLPLFLLFVWIPKFNVTVFEHLREHLDWGDQSRAYAFLAIAAGLYFLSMLFVSRQLFIQLQPAGPAQRSETVGAGQGLYFVFGVIPLFSAAYLADVVFFERSSQLPFDDLVGTSTLFCFATAGAGLWGIPFLIAGTPVSCAKGERKKRPKGEAAPYFKLAWARVGAGVGFGILLAAAFTLLRRLGTSFPEGDDRFFIAVGVPIALFAHLSANTLFVGLSSRVRDHDGVREWTARAGGNVGLIALGWFLYSTVVLWDPLNDWPGRAVVLGLGNKTFQGLVTAVGGVSGVVGALLGKSSLTGATNAGAGDGGLQAKFNWSRIAQLAGLLFFIALTFLLSRRFDAITQLDLSLNRAPLPIGSYLKALAALAIWAVVASHFINVNKFSLHAFYRNRLIRAYLGASNPIRRPSAFTGFDERDNVKMKDLRGPEGAPIHIVNIALNLVRGQRLAWQQRKATSFTVTRLAAGNSRLGYRSSTEYGDEITLGTAMAISGAAVSPNMGYHSSPLLGLLMALFNLRLGWWLGNPRRSGWKKSGPSQSIWPFVVELLGLTDDTQSFVYLSDGGHFENLGLYEVFQRRCRTIIAVDTTCDPDFACADLGNAIRKARIDLGVEVAFDPPGTATVGDGAKRLGLVNRPKPPGDSPYFATARVFYPEGNEAKLIYVKAAIHGDEPEDIGSYAAVNKEFPYDSTANQFFTETQFESYRRLGLQIGLSVFKDTDPLA